MKDAIRRAMVRWLDNHATEKECGGDGAYQIDWAGCVPYLVMHAGCALVFWVGASWIAVGAAVLLYFVRMFFITGFYHRYFSHRSFRSSRSLQFLMALAGCTAVQRGPLWWAGHHRHHHLHSDAATDPHSPHLAGFFMSHTGWFMTRARFPTQLSTVRDWARYPELLWLNRFDTLVPLALAAGLFGIGAWISRIAPNCGVSGTQMLVWGFFISTVAVYHATFTINSLAHQWGSRRFRTSDHSRNNLFLALVTLGEGWHNNHHHFPSASRQGFYWWEIDVTYYVLRGLALVGLIWDLRPVPKRVLALRRLDRPTLPDAGGSPGSDSTEYLAPL